MHFIISKSKQAYMCFLRDFEVRHICTNAREDRILYIVICSYDDFARLKQSKFVADFLIFYS